MNLAQMKSLMSTEKNGYLVKKCPCVYPAREVVKS